MGAEYRYDLMKLRRWNFHLQMWGCSIEGSSPHPRGTAE